MRILFLAVPLLVVSSAFGAEKTHRLDIVNASADNITSIAVAQAGSGVFREVGNRRVQPPPVLSAGR